MLWSNYYLRNSSGKLQCTIYRNYIYHAAIVNCYLRGSVMDFYTCPFSDIPIAIQAGD